MKLQSGIIRLSKIGLTYKMLHFIRMLYYKSRYTRYRKKYSLSESFSFRGVDIEFYGDGEIIIGKDTYIGNRSSIGSVKNAKVKIGDNCSISHNVRIYTSNRNPLDIISEKKVVNKIIGDVIIGSNVWIGANTYINQGVTIGDHCAIGANSVITKNIPSNSIVVGANRIIKRYKS